MIVVTDTSVVLNLAWLRRELLLSALFEEVVAPVQVRDEFTRLAMAQPRFRGLIFPGFIQIQQPKSIPSALAGNAHLDAGERDALALALELKVTTVLIDERIGREMAIQLGLQTIGVLGILQESKRRKLLPEIRPLIDALERDAEFRIHSALRARVLRDAGESE